MTKSVLGKGLSALIPSAPSGLQMGRESPLPFSGSAPDAVTMNASVPGVSLVLLDEIEPNPYQPRRDFNETELEELSKSIQINGLIQPVIVRRNPSGKGYQLIAGERRFRASKLAGLKVIPVVIRKGTDKEALELAIVENIQREDLNVVDLGMAYQRLLDEFRLTQEELADRMGKERATVANTLRMLRLSDETKQDLRSGRLSGGHAKALLAVEEPDFREQLRKEILNRSLSVRQAEERARDFKAGFHATASRKDSPEPMPANEMERRLHGISQELTRKHSRKVEVRGNGKKGKFILHYSSRQDLEEWLGVLQGEKVAWPNSPT